MDTVAEEAKRNGPPRVDKRTSKRGEHSGSQHCDETILGVPRELIVVYILCLFVIVGRQITKPLTGGRTIVGA